MKLKSWKISVIVASIAIIGVGGVMVATNPGRESYQDYATEKMSTYLKDEVCSDAPQFLQGQCANFVDIGKGPMRDMIDDSTERHNYLLFSIYETNLSIAPGTPTYHFRTLGIFQNLILYESKEKE